MPKFEITTSSEIKSNAGGKEQQNQHWIGVTNQFDIQVYLSQTLIGPKPPVQFTLLTCMALVQWVFETRTLG